MALDQVQQSPARFDGGVLVSGTVHVYVAFDWGEEVDLEVARRLLAAEPRALERRRRTPSSFGYSPPPLRFPLEPMELTLAAPESSPSLTDVSGGAAPASHRHENPPVPSARHVADSNYNLPAIRTVKATADATLFDFGGVSVAMHIPFSMTAAELSRLAVCLADSDRLVAHANGPAHWLFDRLRPAISQPNFSPLTEEYVAFELPPGLPLPPPQELLEQHSVWVAGLTRLETDPLSVDEIAAALHSFISYSPHDLLVPEWSAALLIDRDAGETLQTIEFANLQLLEFRFIDKLLDDRLADAYRLIHPLVKTWLPFLRTHAQPLRALGELRIHANSLFERTGNALKLVGDQYLARVYRILAARFHLDEWERSIQRSLEVVEGVYRVLSDQAATYRTELLEIIVIVLIAFEIITAFLKH
jgi:hypothetical protein